MYQIDTSLTMYALKQAEAVFSQYNAMFDQMVDDSLALNRAIMNFDFVKKMTSVEAIELMFLSVAADNTKKNQLGRSVLRRSRRLHRRRYHTMT